MPRNKSEKGLSLPPNFPPAAAPHQDLPRKFHVRAYWDKLDFYAAELNVAIGDSEAHMFWRRSVISFTDEDQDRWSCEMRKVKQLKDFYQAFIKSDPPTRRELLKPG